MAFTGRLGTPSSKLGNIVLGISDELGASIFNCQVHVLTSSQIRVSYTFEVTNTGLDPDNYVLTALADPPTEAVLPIIESIHWYDSTHRSVILQLSQPLTYNYGYSLESNGVYAKIDHEVISGFVRNFIANVQDPPRAIGAWLSKRGRIDVKFDRSVGPTSGSAQFEIDGVPLVQDTWATENLPEDTLRLDYTGTLPVSFTELTLDYIDVRDESLNYGTGSIPITLALRSASPYAEADALQLQFIDAFVIDINSDLIDTTTVRVFFNGPVLDADDTSKWTITQDGAHIWPDSVNDITTADATNLGTLTGLCDAIRVRFNGHLTESQVHVENDIENSLSGSPISLGQCIAFLLIAQTNYLAHVTTDSYHKYRDSVNVFDALPIYDLPTAITAANTIKAYYNSHISATYPVNFSTSYPTPIDAITAYARYGISDRVFDVLDVYTYFADLHLNTKSFNAPLNIEATLTSEDSASTTNPVNYTGSIQARPLSTTAQLITDRVFPDSQISLRFDKGIVIQPLDMVKVSGPDGSEIPNNYEVFATWPTALWALNNLIFAYSIHIDPSNGAGHLSQDTINTISSLDYAELPISNIIDLANSFRVKMTNHITSIVFHYQLDEDIVITSPASDLKSLIKLIGDLQRVLIIHNSKLGVHSFAGRRAISAPLYDFLECNLDYMVDGETHQIEGTIQHYYTDNDTLIDPNKITSYLNPIILAHEFDGLAILPSLSSAIPKNGLVIDEGGVQFESDEVEIYFSKPMRQIPLDISNLTISGGSILQKEASWTNDSVVSIRVSNMESVSYTVTATGLTDMAGNPVY